MRRTCVLVDADLEIDSDWGFCNILDIAECKKIKKSEAVKLSRFEIKMTGRQ